MPLRGTLKDFGIADILQLIGHQGKSGILTIKSGEEEAQVYFCDGNVVRADSASRPKRDLLGRMLVRAEVVSEEQLQRALEMQKRTGKRLGQILIESGVLDRAVLATFTRLQSTETLYRLFVWNTGTYEFSQKEVSPESEFEPIRSENILMEGFRQLDEWPSIRRKITGYGITFEKVEDLDALLAAAPQGDDSGLDDGFGDFDLGDSKPSGIRNIGQTEKVVYQLITPERDVQKIIDLSRLGEFETCKALEHLIDAGIIRAAQAQTKRSSSEEATVGAITVRPRSVLLPTIARMMVVATLLAGIVVGIHFIGPKTLLAAWRGPASGFASTSLQHELSTGQMQRLARALAVYQLQTGTYPDRLEELVTTGLVADRDLRFPWQNPYRYAKKGESYEIVRPLY